jgi:hypothetical protein
MASFTPQPTYSQAKSPQYIRKRRLGETGGKSELSSEEEDLLLSPAVQPAA